jgi:MATE family multidrug resistance protein
MDGFAYAAEALTGKYIGQHSLAQLKQAIKVIFLWGFFLSLPFTLLYAFKEEWILSVLTDDIQIIALAQSYHIWIIIIPTLTFASFLWDGVYIGATAVKSIRNIMIVSGLLVFLPAYYMLKPYLDNHALWLAFSLFMLARGLLMTVWFPKSILSQLK